MANDKASTFVLDSFLGGIGAALLAVIENRFITNKLRETITTTALKGLRKPQTGATCGIVTVHHSEEEAKQ